ncbi:MAG: flavin reductase family protein, partial [Firmicutes bacterium]|nr:flavin reductase family protein [Bacillota bacterium]
MNLSQLRHVLSQFGTGVLVVFTHCTQGWHGMTANAFSAVSLEPPLIALNVSLHAQTARWIAQCPEFMANILSESQADLARRFAQPDNDFDQAIGRHPLDI